jgi:hypothetical protein
VVRIFDLTESSLAFQLFLVVAIFAYQVLVIFLGVSWALKRRDKRIAEADYRATRQAAADAHRTRFDGAAP